MHVRSPYPSQVSERERAGMQEPDAAHRRWPRRGPEESRSPRRWRRAPAPARSQGAEPEPSTGSPTPPPTPPAALAAAVRRRRRGGVTQRLLQFAWPPPPWQPLAAAAGVLTLLGGLGLLLGAHRGSVMPVHVVALDAALAVGFLPAGLVAVHRRPRRLAPLLIVMTGLLALLALASAAWSGLFVGAWLAHWTWWPAVSLLPVLLLCYPTAPTGDRARGWVDVAAFAAAAGTGCLMDAAAVSPNADLIEESRRIGVAATLLTLGWLLAALVSVGTLAGAVIRLLVQGARGRQSTRRWTLCLLPAAAAAPVGAVLTCQGLSLAYLLPVPLLGVGLAAGLLPDDDGRGDRWWQDGLAAFGCATIGYLLVSAGFARLPGLAVAYPWLVPTTGAVLVLGIVAATARWWWRGIGALTSRLRYGPERASYATLRDAQHVAGPAAPTALEVADAVTSALGVHGTRVRADLGVELVTVAEYGRCTDPRTSLVIEYGGRRLGVLEITPDDPGRVFDEHELATLRRAARRAATALAADQAVRNASHARVVATTRREADRSWMRTELHDTFLPALSGCRGQLEAARLRMPSRRTAALLDPVIDELTEVSAAVRELMDRLRPDILEHGLRTAITQVARRRLPSVDVRVEVPETTGGTVADLPCAVEVAAYRIAVEALTCAALRGGVRSATVRLTRTPRQVDLTVLDDGAAALSASVGDGGDTSVMRALTEDIGGRLSVISSAAGTRIYAVLPLTVVNGREAARPAAPGWAAVVVPESTEPSASSEPTGTPPDPAPKVAQGFGAADESDGAASQPSVTRLGR